MGSKVNKTNVMRLLDAAKLEYGVHCYEGSGAVSGTEVAAVIGAEPARVFKTLVTVGKSRQNYVFVIPVAAELDLKKAADSVGEKAIEMIQQRELLPLTGYVHGGCSPIGMKKPLPTVFDSSAAAFEKIIFSAGKIGWQVELSPEDLKKLVDFSLANLTK